MRVTEFVVPERPLSVQARQHDLLHAWRQLIVLHALHRWTGKPLASGEVHLTIVFLCDPTAPIDVDNVVKPIQDALLNVAYTNDVLVTDVDSHRRYVGDLVDITGCSRMLIQMINKDTEAVYVRLQEADELGVYL